MAIAELFSGLTPVADAAADAHPDAAAAVDDSGDWQERAAIVENDAGAPREWAEGLATLEACGPPPGWPVEDWRQLVHDAGRFVDDWGRQASALGWAVGDIFGFDRRGPSARSGALGLVARVCGGRVVALTADTARIQHTTGEVTVCHRRPSGEACDGFLWEVAREQT